MIQTKSVILKPAPIVQSRAINDYCGETNVSIQDCSKVRTQAGFSSGTFKDYRSSRLVNDFGERNPVLYSIVYTTAGYSLGNIVREYNQLNGFNEETGIKVVSVIDQGLDARIKGLLSECSELVEVSLDERVYSRQEIRGIVTEAIGEKGREFIDVENYDFSYIQLAEAVLDFNPDYVFMPLGGGEAVNSVLNALERVRKTGREVPRLVATTINASIYGGRTQESSLAEKLATPFSGLFEKVSGRIGKFGEIVVVSEDEIMPAYFALQEAGIKAEPSAGVAFAAARKTEIPEGKSILIVNSGSGIYFDESNNLRGAIWQ
ncbi:pyridoxal-phosphate dependent enzyme [Candidatus Woesearchaeota archaeon]|nr:pyridoxal-phosphate dependent enzyme [Candidatus Woesearchaeota archaeon]MBT6336120.1 pyridoxal-phosphate dependent enzyme [Candidatus Woesearchaeota archaeon]MBT7928065.1 pyridoxal-phosphate dependent enzyme [Candidatus Woesearchaeota archaeon]